MPVYLHQVSYNAGAMAKLIADPQDRVAAVRAPIEKLGGKIKDAYFAFGEHDVILITEFPDNVAAAAISMAFAAGGSVRSSITTPLMTTSEAVEAMRKAGASGYKAIAATAGK